METRKETLSNLEVCRFCLSSNETLIPLYDNKNRTPKNAVPFALKILSCLALEIFPSDKMPQFICKRCKLFMEISYAYKQLCRQTDESILQYVQQGSPLSPMSWPAQLSKVYRSTKPEGVMKTVVEGGLKVLAEEVSDSDTAEDENVFNIKIGDGSEDCKSIKIITSVNKTENASGNKTRKGFASVSKLTRHVREHAGARSYPCKHCGKSFTKSHHYTRHLRLKHQTELSANAYRCDECEATFATQDELLYHSALHATKNLVCPLCQEKFQTVDEVTAHIKSHVNGSEYMCDFCELIFTSKEKLDSHIAAAHDDELTNDQETEPDESSMDMDAGDEDEDNSIKMKEENGHIMVEIKNTNEYMLPVQRDDDDKHDLTQSEDSDAPYTESTSTQIEPLPTTQQEQPVECDDVIISAPEVVEKPHEIKTQSASKPETTQLPPTILMKVEEMKRKALQQTPPEPSIERKERKPISKVESSAATGASDKSLRLLEKELQDLKRTNTLVSSKTPTKPIESLRSRRPQPYTSTPKTRIADKKETPAPKLPEKVAPVERKPERKTTKDSKELKEVKSNNNNLKEDKEVKDKGNGKENKEAVKDERKEVKEKETTKSVKNGATENSPASEETVRRSTRPSKVKDYAKMLRDGSVMSEDESEEEESEEYKEDEKTPEQAVRRRGRPSLRSTTAPTTAATPEHSTPTTAPRKRGRPRKEQAQPVPNKLRKDENSDEESEPPPEKTPTPKETPKDTQPPIINEGIQTPEANKSPPEPNSNVVFSPSGQTLKKIPIKSLPPGVKPLPLPLNSRLPGAREVCEMQIGKKVVKVQKIVMTKAEVEAMAKQGLVEMKDGTMVLKQGIKLPSADPMSLKSKLMGEAESKKESPSKDDSAHV